MQFWQQVCVNGLCIFIKHIVKLISLHSERNMDYTLLLKYLHPPPTHTHTQSHSLIWLFVLPVMINGSRF